MSESKVLGKRRVSGMKGKPRTVEVDKTTTVKEIKVEVS